VEDLVRRFTFDRDNDYRIRHFMERIPSSRCLRYRKRHHWRSPQTRSRLDPTDPDDRAEWCGWCRKTFGEVCDEQERVRKTGKPPSKDTFIWWIHRVFSLNKVIRLDDYWKFLNKEEPFTAYVTPRKKYERWLREHFLENTDSLWVWIKEYAEYRGVKAYPYSAYRGGLGYVEFRRFRR